MSSSPRLFAARGGVPGLCVAVASLCCNRERLSSGLHTARDEREDRVGGGQVERASPPPLGSHLAPRLAPHTSTMATWELSPLREHCLHTYCSAPELTQLPCSQNGTPHRSSSPTLVDSRRSTGTASSCATSSRSRSSAPGPCSSPPRAPPPRPTRPPRPRPSTSPCRPRRRSTSSSRHRGTASPSSSTPTKMASTRGSTSATRAPSPSSGLGSAPMASRSSCAGARIMCVPLPDTLSVFRVQVLTLLVCAQLRLSLFRLSDPTNALQILNPKHSHPHGALLLPLHPSLARSDDGSTPQATRSAPTAPSSPSSSDTTRATSSASTRPRRGPSCACVLVLARLRRDEQVELTLEARAQTIPLQDPNSDLADLAWSPCGRYLAAWSAMTEVRPHRLVLPFLMSVSDDLSPRSTRFTSSRPTAASSRPSRPTPPSPLPRLPPQPPPAHRSANLQLPHLRLRQS